MAINYLDNNWKENVKEGFWLVDFFSETCGPCKMLAKNLETLDFEFPVINFGKVNLTKYPEIGEELEVRAVPTIFFMKDGELLERHIGLLSVNQLKEKISQYLYE
ncbi:MAG TPA: thioredoxin family protein [Haloplasmataceae bacterium]